MPGWNDRFKSFQRVHIGSVFHGVFKDYRLKRLYKKNILLKSKTIRDLKKINHFFREFH